jgi:hypothetical protein
MRTSAPISSTLRCLKFTKFWQETPTRTALSEITFEIFSQLINTLIHCDTCVASWHLSCHQSLSLPCASPKATVYWFDIHGSAENAQPVTRLCRPLLGVPTTPTKSLTSPHFHHPTPTPSPNRPASVSIAHDLFHLVRPGFYLLFSH